MKQLSGFIFFLNFWTPQCGLHPAPNNLVKPLAKFPVTSCPQAQCISSAFILFDLSVTFDGANHFLLFENHFSSLFHDHMFFLLISFPLECIFQRFRLNHLPLPIPLMVLSYSLMFWRCISVNVYNYGCFFSLLQCPLLRDIQISSTILLLQTMKQ